MKIHTSNFKEEISKFGRQIDSRITFGETVLGKDDLNAVTPSYQGAILKSVMKQLEIDSNVKIPLGTILTYEFGLKVDGEYEYVSYGNYIVYNVEKQEDTKSYKITCYDKLLYSMLDYVKLPITYPISIRDYIGTLSMALGLNFANKNDEFANYDKQIQADLYDGLGYTFRDVLDELAQVTASTICLNNNDELEIRYITETGDTIDEEFLKDVNVNFGEKFGAVNTIVLSRSADSDSVYYPSVLPANPYEIKISDNQIMNGNDRADFLPDIYNKLNGLEFYTNDFVSTGIVYYDLCDRYSVKVGDTTYSCVMFNDEVLVTQGLEENVYTELPEQTETDYKHASKDDRMINQVYIIAKKNEAEILALVSTTETIEKEINPTKDESGSEIIIEDGSNRPLNYLEIEGKSTQETRSGKNLFNINGTIINGSNTTHTVENNIINVSGEWWSGQKINVKPNTNYTISANVHTGSVTIYDGSIATWITTFWPEQAFVTFNSGEYSSIYLLFNASGVDVTFSDVQLEEGTTATEHEAYGVMPSPDYPSEIESVGYENLLNFTRPSFGTIVENEDGSFNWSYPYAQNLGMELTGQLKSGTYTITNYGDINLFIQKSADDYTTNALKNGGTKTFTYDGTSYLRLLYGATTPNVSQLFKTMMTKGTQQHSYIPLSKYGIEVEIVSKNKFDIDNSTFAYMTKNSDGSFTANIQEGYYATFYGNETLRQLFLNSLGKPFTFSVENNYGLNISVVIIGTRSNGSTYQEANTTGNSVTITIANDFTSISSIEFRVLRKSAKYTDTTTVIRNPQLIEDSVNVNYQPYHKSVLAMILDQPLRSLPNGVKDIAYIRNNKLYVDRYVGNIVLNGSEEWTINQDTNNYISCYLGTNPYKNITFCMSNYFAGIKVWSSEVSGFDIEAIWNHSEASFGIKLLKSRLSSPDVAGFKQWLSNHNTQVDYELAETYTEELGEIETLTTLKGYNEITTTDDLQPTLNIQYVRDTVIANYVENHVTELKLNEEQIRQSVETVSSSVDGLTTDISRVEQITTDTSQVLNIISTNIDKSTGEVREVTTTTGFTFNSEGSSIKDSDGFEVLQTPKGAYYKDNGTITGQYTKDGSKQKDLELFGTYSYGKTDIDDTPMFVGQLYTDENGEEAFGHFYNGGDY